MTKDIEYVAIDPVLGEISCDNWSQALDYAVSVGGQAHAVVWQDGFAISRRVMADYLNRKAQS